MTTAFPASRPNVLFIFSDQHAQRVAGCYGDPVALTPNLDALAAGGVVFENAYCPSPICVPSRMSMLTARHPYSQACWTNDDYLRPDYATWLHAAGAAGYRPVLAGRLHAMGPDQLHGYAERLVGDHSPNWAGVPRHDLGVLEKANDPWRDSVTLSGTGQSAYQVKDDATVDAACGRLEAIAARRAAGDSEPFCLTVGLLLPHPPYVASAEDYARFEGRVGPPAQPGPLADEHAWLSWWRANRDLGDLDPQEVLRARTAYYALTWRMDALIGEVLSTLARLGLDENTLIVYSSDHGDHLGERGLWWKHTLCEESVKVPLIFSWPGRLPAGERRDQVVNLVDVAATLVDAMGAPPLPHGQGRSLLGVAGDAGCAWADETFSEYCADVTPAWTGEVAVQQRMVRRGRFKLVYVHGHDAQLFDLVADPLEARDLATDPQFAAIRQDLLARVLDGWNPDHIADTIAQRRLDKNVIGAWARHTRPPDVFRWDLQPALNRLDRPGGDAAAGKHAAADAATVPSSTSN